MISKKIQKKIFWRYQNFLVHSLRLYYQINQHPHQNNIIVFGSGRSGTTLLAEALAQLDNAKLIDEPLKNSSSHKIDKLPLTGWGQYIPEFEKDWPEANIFFDRLLSGLEFNPNHLRDTSNLFKTKTWVFKMIRANLLMPWLIQNFDIPKPIYVIRNPYAVVASRLKHPGWGLHRSLHLHKPIPIPRFKYYEEFYQQYDFLFNQALRLEERLAAGWILENDYILKHHNHVKHWLSIDYKDFIITPKETLEKIGQELGFEVNAKMLETVQKPSYSSSKKQIDKNTQLNGWKKSLSPEQFDLITKVLEKSKLTNFIQNTL